MLISQTFGSVPSHLTLYFSETCRTPEDAPKTAMAMAMKTMPTVMNDPITACTCT